MDEQTQEIAKRLDAYFTDDEHRFVFWEDEDESYKDTISSIELEKARLIDVTGRELASKREMMRTCSKNCFVIYRSGPVPLPVDDFLYDLKLASVPFTVNLEGIWAEECGINPKFAGNLSAHARFFSSKERMRALAETALPKTTLDEVQFAMLCACTNVKVDNYRDGARAIVARLVAENFKENAATYRLIQESALGPVFWSMTEELMGYRPISGEATLEDLAFNMLVTSCAPLLPEETDTLNSEAVRVIEDLARNPKTKDAYDKIVESFGSDVVDLIPTDMRCIANLVSQDALPDFDQWILLNLVEAAKIESLTSTEIEKIIRERSIMRYYPAYENHYECLRAATKMREELEKFDSSLPACSTAKSVFDAYCTEWYKVDEAYRHFDVAYTHIVTRRFKQEIESIHARVLSSYDDFVMRLTDRWQLTLMEGSSKFPPTDIPSQRDFFKDEVRKRFPAAEDKRRIGVIVSDGMRYEVGRELASRLSASKHPALKSTTEVECKGALCMLPSYTQLGMAALLPEGELEIDAKSGKVKKSGKPTFGNAAREKLLDEAYPGSVVFNDKDVLANGIPESAKEASIIYVYHDTIDFTGDKNHTERNVFKDCEQAIQEIEKIANELAYAKCGHVLVTADHGFLYQAGCLDSFQYAEIPSLSILNNIEGMDFNHSRRFIVADVIPKNDMLIEYSAEDLSLKGDAKIALAKGTTRLRVKGSGAGYVHGGASLEEDIIPIVHIKIVKKSQGSHEVAATGFAIGRTSITGSAVSVDVYQEEPCSDTILPTIVKVGLYADESAKKLLSTSERILELSSTQESTDARKTRVSLDITNAVDDYKTAYVVISRRIGNTNSFKPIWSQPYSVNRGFGNDFDF